MHPGDGNGGAHSNAVTTVYWNHQEATGVTRPAMVRLTLPSTLKGGRRSLANLGATVTVTKPAAVQKLDAELSAAELVKRYGTVAMTRVTHTHTSESPHVFWVFVLCRAPPVPAHSYEEHEPDAVEDITVTYYKNKQTDATSENNKAQGLSPSFRAQLWLTPSLDSISCHGKVWCT